MAEPGASRVVLIQEDDISPLGTGYLIDGSHVLTARRAVEGHEEVTLASISGELYRARPEWYSRSGEAALLHIVDGRFSDIPYLPLSQERFIPFTAPQSAQAIGYMSTIPTSAASGTGGAVGLPGEFAQVTGEVRSSGDEPDGTFEFVTSLIAPRSKRRPSRDEMLGAPVWVGQELLGIGELAQQPEPDAARDGRRARYLGHEPAGRRACGLAANAWRSVGGGRRPGHSVRRGDPRRGGFRVGGQPGEP